jgi:hypothetical protein
MRTSRSRFGHGFLTRQESAEPRLCREHIVTPDRREGLILQAPRKRGQRNMGLVYTDGKMLPPPFPTRAIPIGLGEAFKTGF